MKTIQFSVDSVLDKLSNAFTVVPSKSLIPAYSDFCMETKKDDATGAAFLSVTVCDGDTWLKTRLPLISPFEDVSFCVEAKILLRALSNLTGKILTINIDEQSKNLTCSYEGGSFTLPYKNAQDYPQFKEQGSTDYVKEMPSHELIRAINSVVYAVSNEDQIRPVLASVCFDFSSPSMTTVGTDGRRLVIFTARNVLAGDRADGECFVLPSKPARILARSLKNMSCNAMMAFNENHLIVSDGDNSITFCSRLLDSKFPRYKSVIPQSNNLNGDVDSASFSAALKRILPMTNTTSSQVTLTFEKDRVVVKGEDVDSSRSAVEYVACEYSDEPITIAFNGSLLAHSIANIQGQTIRFSLKSPQTACLLSGITSNGQEDYEHITLMMPLLIGD